MKIIVDLINKSLKVLENEKNIYVGNNNADVLEVYCYNGGYHLENEFVSITGTLSNGRKIGPFTTDSAYDEEYIDGKLHTLAKFTLTKQNGFTLSEGQLNITVWHNKTNDSGAIISKQAIGNLLFNVVKTANVDDNIIITDASGDVIYNFKLEIENIQSAVNSVNSSFVKFKQHTEESIMRLEENKADLEVMWDAFDNTNEKIPYGDRKFAWLLNFTGDSLLIDMINELNSRDLFVDDKGKFWVEIGLENPTVIEDIRITKQKKANGYLTGYGINSIIRSGTTIRVFMKSVAKDSTMTINEFIDLHKQVAIKEEVPTKVSQLENDTEYISLETLNDTKDELRKYADNKVANLVNSAPSTLDTLGELAAALEDNKDVVEALDEAIGNKANKDDVPTKTSQLTNDSAFINQTQLDEALANLDVGGGTGGSGSEVKLYAHNIELTVEDIYVWFTIYNLSSTPLNLDNLKTYSMIWYPASIMDDNANPDNFQGIIRISNDGTIDIYGSPYDEGNENQYIYKSNLNINQAYFADYVSLISSTTASGGSGGSGKEVVEITTPLLVGDTGTLGANQTANFDNIDLNNKYIIWDWNIEREDNLDRVQEIYEILLDFNSKQPKNSTIYMQIPYLDNLSEATFVMELPNDFIGITGEQFIDDLLYIECNRVYGDYFSCLFYGNKWADRCFNISIKIDFDENGFATISFMHFYES